MTKTFSGNTTIWRAGAALALVLVAAG